VYWVKRQDNRDVLVFDKGHKEGSVYVYELKEPVTIEQVKDGLRRHYNPVNPSAAKIPEPVSVELWVEKKYGFPTAFDLREE
jgi:hypothetical protein